MLRPVLLFLLLAFAAVDADKSSVPPPTTTAADSGSGSGSGDGVGPTTATAGDSGSGGSGSPCSPQGTGTASFAVRLGTFPLSGLDSGKVHSLEVILATILDTSVGCVQVVSADTDKNGQGVVGVHITGMSDKSLGAANYLTGPNTPLSNLFSSSVQITDVITSSNPGTGGPTTTNTKSGVTTEAPPVVLSCTSSGAGSVSFTLVVDAVSFLAFDAVRQAHMKNFFASVLSTQGGCVGIATVGYDSSGTPYIDVLVTSLENPQTARDTLVAADLTALQTASFASHTVTLTNPVAIGTDGKDKDETTTTTTTTAPTTPFDYYTLLPLAIANIDPNTGMFSLSFQQRVADGCAADRNFCILIMNILTNYITMLSLANQTPPNKEGTQYSTAGASSSSLSLATVLAITGGAVALVLVVAMILAKLKTGRFVPLRPSSRVSTTSDTRILTGHPSRISVRAWPQAMEV